MNRNSLNRMGIDKLSGLYSVISEICSDYSRMTDGYSLATGDQLFETMPDDIKNMIDERQKFFSYRNIIKEIIKDKIIKIMENEEN